MNYLFFDTETTGMINFNEPVSHSSQPRLIQLAWKLYDENYKCRSSFYGLIKPSNWEITPEASAINGISMDDCIKFGVSGNTVVELFLETINLADLVIAHNLHFDSKMIRIECYNRCIELVHNWKGPKNYCTMLSSTSICKLPGSRGYKWPKLSEAYEHFTGKILEGAHDALVDIDACKDVFRALHEEQRVH